MAASRTARIEKLRRSLEQSINAGNRGALVQGLREAFERASEPILSTDEPVLMAFGAGAIDYVDLRRHFGARIFKVLDIASAGDV